MANEPVVNLYTLKNPVICEVLENRRLTPETYNADNDVRHLVLRPQRDFPYLPGQSVGVLLPGLDPNTKKPHKPRIYSIASKRGGDLGGGHTLSLTVVRHFWESADSGIINVPGLISNYLCDLQIGETIRITGPVGRHLVLPEDFQTRDFIFVATGTGIAPYRGMMREMFEAGCQGSVCLYFGVQYHDVVLYEEEFRAYAAKCERFHFVTAVSREEKNPLPDKVPTRENRMYVQVKVYQDRERLKAILAKPTSIMCICGLKGMEAGIYPVLETIGVELGITGSFVEKLKSEQRLRVEVY